MSKLRHGCEEEADKVIKEGEIVRFPVMLREITEALFYFYFPDCVSRVTLNSFFGDGARHALSHGALPAVSVTGNPEKSHLGLVAANKCVCVGGGGRT